MPRKTSPGSMSAEETAAVGPTALRFAVDILILSCCRKLTEQRPAVMAAKRHQLHQIFQNLTNMKIVADKSPQVLVL
jgi:hypothetical protein